MGLLSKLMGNASEVEAGKLQTELAQVLAPHERVEKAYQLIRDMSCSPEGEGFVAAWTRMRDQGTRA